MWASSVASAYGFVAASAWHQPLASWLHQHGISVWRHGCIEAWHQIWRHGCISMADQHMASWLHQHGIVSLWRHGCISMASAYGVMATSAWHQHAFMPLLVTLNARPL
jgi:hypothetical protein